jgi:cellulose synthase operon protein C
MPSLWRLAVGCVVGVALCAHASGSKPAQTAREEKTVTKRALNIEESPAKNVIYFEESGGIILPNAKPRAADIRERLPPLDAGKQASARAPAVPKATPSTRVEPPLVARQSPAPRASRPTQPNVSNPPTKLASQPGKATPTQTPASTLAAPAIPTPPTSVADTSRPADPRTQLFADAEALFASKVSGSTESMRSIEGNLRERVIAAGAESLAARLGWAWIEAGDASNARLWFHRALTWQPSNEEAVRGSATAALLEKDYAGVIALADMLPSDAPVRVALLRDGWLGLGQQAYEAGQFEQVLQAFANAEKAATLPRYARQLRGWTRLKLAQSDLAVSEFAALFSESADADAAQGLLAAFDAAGRAPADQIARVEPLAGMLRERTSNRAFAARRILEAKQLNPSKWADTGATGARAAGLAIASRSKTGTSGLGQLELDDATAVSGSVPVGHAMAASIVHLKAKPSAGVIPPNTPFGTEAQAAANANALTATSVRETHLAIRYEGGFAATATVGQIDAGNGSRRSVGSVEWQATPKAGQVQVRGYKEPIRESVLSWVGARDVATGQHWGAVDRHGLEVRGLYLAAAPFSVGAQALTERISGAGVEDNRRKTYGVSVGRNIDLAGFAYASLSLGASEDRYARNLNNYTLGHGGYFSPQQYRRVGPAFDFMTSEAKPWIVRGRAEVVRSAKRESSEEVFPQRPNGIRYGASQSRATDSGLSIAGVKLFGSHVLVGFAARVSNSSQFRERAASIEVRISFDRLKALTSADVPQLWGG